MKKFLLFIFILGLILFATNPNKQDFKEHLATELEENEADDLGGILGGIFSKSVSSVIANNTEIKDYQFFTIYTVKISEEEERYLGILGHFFEL